MKLKIVACMVLMPALSYGDSSKLLNFKSRFFNIEGLSTTVNLSSDQYNLPKQNDSCNHVDCECELYTIRFNSLRRNNWTLDDEQKLNNRFNFFTTSVPFIIELNSNQKPLTKSNIDTCIEDVMDAFYPKFPITKTTLSSEDTNSFELYLKNRMAMQKKIQQDIQNKLTNNDSTTTKSFSSWFSLPNFKEWLPKIFLFSYWTQQSTDPKKNNVRLPLS